MWLTSVPGSTHSSVEGCVDFEQAFEYQGVGAVLQRSLLGWVSSGYGGGGRAGVGRAHVDHEEVIIKDSSVL